MRVFRKISILSVVMMLIISSTALTTTAADITINSAGGAVNTNIQATDYTLEEFQEALKNADHVAFYNFDNSSNYDSSNITGTNSTAKITLSNASRVELTETSVTVNPNTGKADRNNQFASGKGVLTISPNTEATIKIANKVGNLRAVAVGCFVSVNKWAASYTASLTATPNSGDVQTGVIEGVKSSDANKLVFCGFRALKPSNLTYLKITPQKNTIRVDDICVIYQTTDEVTQDAEADFAINSLKIYGDNFTEYVPLDSYGAIASETGNSDVIITWESSDESIITTDGKVYPVVNEEKNVTLTATAKAPSGVTSTKRYKVSVPAVTPYVIEGVKVTGEDGLVDNQLVSGKKIEKISVKCYDSSIKKLTVATALYDKENKLKDIKVEEVTPGIEAQSHGDIILSDPLIIPSGDISDYTAKIMLWSSIENLIPICSAYTVNPVSENITVHMIGDSLMASPVAVEYPRGGWGYSIGNYFNAETVTVNNTYGISGMSSKTFIADEARLSDIESRIKEGDYIFLMLGHNDADFTTVIRDSNDGGMSRYINKHSGIGKYGNYEGDTLSYFGYISNIVKMAREKKANVVLFTSFNRAHLTTDNLEGYPDAMKAFAAEQNLPVIDTTAASVALYEKLYEKGEELVEEGKVKSADDFARNIFLYLTKNDPRFDWDSYSELDLRYSNGVEDPTHFTMYGADVRARLAVLGVIEAGIPIARYEKLSVEEFDTLCEEVIAEILATEYYGKIN